MRSFVASLLVLLLISLSGCYSDDLSEAEEVVAGTSGQTGATSTGQPSREDLLQVDPAVFASLPSYDGVPFTEINGNEPFFLQADEQIGAFEEYGPLDSLGRPTWAFALVGKETMPTQKRGNISEVHPTGWHTDRYSFVDGGALYNRCHLIAHSLAGEDANAANLITGTRSMNAQGMQPFEDEVLEYIRTTGNHVLYRVTPYFEGVELVARGVLMEARSIDDGGDGISFCVYCFNVQPGVAIDYATGDNNLDEASGQEGDARFGMKDAVASGSIGTSLEGGAAGTASTKVEEGAAEVSVERAYVLNTNTRRFHYPDCASVKEMKSKNRKDITGSRDDIMAMGYGPCGSCHP